MISHSKVTLLFALLLLATLGSDVNAIGYNGRMDILQTANHYREEIDSLLLNNNYHHQHDKEHMMMVGAGEIQHLKEIVKNDKKNDDEEDERRSISRKALIMAAKNGFMISSELDNIVTNIVEASEIVERQSMI